MTLAFRSGLGCAPFKTNPLRLPLVCQQPITVFLHYRLPLVGLYFVRSTPRGLLQTAVSRPSRVLSSSPCALKSRSCAPASLAGSTGRPVPAAVAVRRPASDCCQRPPRGTKASPLWLPALPRAMPARRRSFGLQPPRHAARSTSSHRTHALTCSPSFGRGASCAMELSWLSCGAQDRRRHG